MFVTVNGEPVPVPAPATLESLLNGLAPVRPFAVACNGEFVPGSTYARHELSDGDQIEIVHPSAGG